MTVQVVETDVNAGSPSRFLERDAEVPLDLLPRRLLCQGEVQVLREPVVREVALLERGSALEREAIPQWTPGQPNEEPREAVVALQDGLRDAPPSPLGEPIG